MESSLAFIGSRKNSHIPNCALLLFGLNATDALEEFGQEIEPNREG
jgi:hypothetical protein